MKNLYVFILAAILLFLLMSKSSTYTYQDVGNEHGMKFWNPKVFYGPRENLARN
jgi:hypothetical protein